MWGYFGSRTTIAEDEIKLSDALHAKHLISSLRAALHHIPDDDGVDGDDYGDDYGDDNDDGGRSRELSSRSVDLYL